MSGTKPGWFYDPADPTRYRWWDGSAWTNDYHYPDADSPSPYRSATREQPAGKPKRSSIRRWVLIAAGAVIAVLVIGGGAVYALLGGGGPQPEQAMPADTIGYVKVDLDPSAGQKINLIRLIRDNVPAGTFDEGPSTGDPLADAINASGLLDGADFTWGDIDAWAGDRAAVAVLPGIADTQPVVVGIVAVDDESAMRAFLSRSGADAAVGMVRDGYAVIAEDQSTVNRVVGSTSWLVDSPSFREVSGRLGGGQIVAGYVDMGAAWAQVRRTSGGYDDFGYVPNVTGQAMMALTVSPDSVTLSTATNDLAFDGQAFGSSVEAVDDLSSLPVDTVAAISISGLGQALRESGIDQAAERSEQLYYELGDVSVSEVLDLLSSTVTVYMVPGEMEFGGQPSFAARIARSEWITASAWESALYRFGVGNEISVSDSGDYVWLTSANQPLFPNEAGPGLGGTDEFRSVIGGPGQTMGYVNLAELWRLLRSSGDYTGDLPDGFRAAGLVATSDTGNPGDSRVDLTVSVRPPAD